MTAYANGLNGTSQFWNRFGDVPPSIDIPVLGDVEEAVEVDLTELNDDPTELCTLLENENVAKKYWVTISLAYAKQSEIDHAIEVIQRGLSALRTSNVEDRLSYLNALTWMYFCKCRDAPRIKPADSAPDFRTKEFYIREATSTLNDIGRLSPGYRNLPLARGVLALLRASIQAVLKPMTQGEPDRGTSLKDALKNFETALRLSGGRNIMALMGKARVQFSMRQYSDALHIYQTILERAPQTSDPDPRIGIGCCFWQLGHREDAKLAWDRALEVNPKSKWANILLGIYYLHHSSQFATSDPDFVESYGKAMTQYTQNAWRIDKTMPLACSTFGGYFLVRKLWKQLEMLARTSIEYADITDIASDGWYLLARKEHEAGDYSKAYEHYIKADNCRGGAERGYLPAKFGAAQIKILQNDPETAKFQLDKLLKQSKTIEAQTLQGMLFAEAVFASKVTATTKEEIAKQKEDINNQRKTAIGLLEQVRVSWKDPKRKTAVDPAILLNLARLYEIESPEKSLQCLRQVEQIEIEAIPEELRPVGIEDEEERQKAMREILPAPLLNNMGCFHFLSDKITEAREIFQSALNACAKIAEDDSTVDSDAFKTTISYNLGRAYEAEGMLDEAQKVYEDLLVKHGEYSDALARLAFISYQKNPDEGIKDMQVMFEGESENLEIRALYGWFLNRTKKRTVNFAEDEEQKHNKQSLSMAKYDTYVLTSMGNICLSIAREMRGDEVKDRRRKTYERALEFFERALVLDPQNAYAAQGVGIAVVEDKRDLAAAVQIFTNVRETMKDATVYMNLGHVYCELKQFSRAIESYEAALAKRDRVSEVSVLSSLGRVWYMKGRHEKSVSALQQSLEFSTRVLDLMPDQVHFRFNVAFVQIHIADLMAQEPATQRTLVGLETAAADLIAAVDTLTAMAKEPNPPYPPQTIEERANMGKTRQSRMERAITEQKTYEEQNSTRLAAAREQREAERRRREEERLETERKAEERRQRLLEERAAMLEIDRELATRQAEEEAMRVSDDEATRRKKSTRKSTGGQRRGKKRRGDDDVVSDGHLSSDEARYSDEDGGMQSAGGSEGGEVHRERDSRPAKKKRRLQRRGGKAEESKKSSKYKSDDRIVDSDEEAEMFELDEPADGNGHLESEDARSPSAPIEDSDAEMRDEDEEDLPAAKVRTVKKRAVVDSDDDE